MLERERFEGYRTLTNPCGLVLPVKVADGHHFPAFAREIQHFDCSRFARIGDGFKQTERYVEFQDDIEEWVSQVALAVDSAPEWNQEWVHHTPSTLPQSDEPPFAAPVMA
jgi:hypothetical protein